MKNTTSRKLPAAPSSYGMVEAKPAVVRPPITYVGAKTRFVPWVVSLMPPHNRYVDAFGGSGAILLNKTVANHEVYNDLDANLVNFMEVLADPKKRELLKRRLDHTAYSRDLHAVCVQRYRRAKASGNPDVWHAAMSDVEWAAMSYVLWMQSYNAKWANSFSISHQLNKSRATIFRLYHHKFEAVAERLRNVHFECRDYQRVCRQHDDVDTLFYLDPPYFGPTRSRIDYYRHEMHTEAEHRTFLEFACGLKGKVMIAGYPSDLYSGYLKGWHVTTAAGTIVRLGKDAKHTEETIWMNFEPGGGQ